MDYLEIYNESFTIAKLKGETITRESLESLKKEKRNSNFAYNRTLELLETHIKKSIISENENLTNLERYFQQTLSSYDEDAIEFTLKKEITSFYNKLTSNDLPKDYSFSLMIKDLAEYRGLNEIARLFRNQSTLYEMMYNLDDFSHFKIENYGNIHYEDTPLFNELRERLYPNEGQTDVKNITSNTPSSVIFGISPDGQTLYPFNSINTDEESLLTEEETAVLIYIYNKIQQEKIIISQSQLYKCLSLMKVKSTDSFKNNKSYKNSPVYKILNNKFKKANLNNLTKTDKSDIKDLISVSTELLSKVKNHNINKIESEINAFLKEIKLIIA